MTDKQDRAAVFSNLTHPLETLLLKLRVADGQHLVDDQNLSLHVRGDAEREAHVHSGRVTLYGCVNELLDFRERYNLVELATDLRLAHAEYCTVEKDILAAC